MRGIADSKDSGILFKNKKKSTAKIKIGVINLMPFKVEVESQFFNLLGRYSLAVEVEFLYPDNHISKHTSMEYLEKNYIPLSKLEERNYQGLIITGAPIENREFEDVKYWGKLKPIFDLDIPSIYICWASQGALYHHYKISKHPLKEKIFGIFNHSVNKNKLIQLDKFHAPHSRNTYNKKEDLLEAGLVIVAENEKAGVYMATTKNLQKIYISGHGEYQINTLDKEYRRDLKNLPENYYRGNDPTKEILFTWDKHRDIFYKNWLDMIIK
ncbi:homoserine O-acetyltransferase/O-succinyltransferase family protein [Psychrilyobacter atlanticus]|uniref:homoserine O-acetyltransferase/O-succinyltransferase family protein n=1 Tax=Psychrilyobacter atlanticus TaxID=271091 RepID=UPI000407EB6F|nr:homoserine O-succinyltransferase [Psychrilyobacter atlanticus]